MTIIHTHPLPEADRPKALSESHRTCIKAIRESQAREAPPDRPASRGKTP